MKTIKIIWASALGYLSLVSGYYVQLYAFVFVAMLLDYFTGVCAAGHSGSLSSKKAARGLYKKAAYLLLLSFGFFLDQAIPYFTRSGLGIDMGINFSIGLMFAAWIVLTEALSILENFVNLGINVPTFIRKMLQVAKNEIENNEEPQKPVQGIEGGEQNENIH